MGEVLEYLLGFVSENKKQKFDEILDNRTRYLTVVLEDIYYSQNASAVVRSCDCFGIQDLHVIENRFLYKVNKDIVLGASKWVSLYKYRKRKDNTIDCLQKLKDDGYKIIATTPHQNDVNLEDYQFTSKTAILFGNEQEGLSPEALKMADGFLKIPMVGFTESLNISVSAAICLHSLSYKLRNTILPWQLSEQERNEVKYKWARSIIRKADLVEKNYLLKRAK